MLDAQACIKFNELFVNELSFIFCDNHSGKPKVAYEFLYELLDLLGGNGSQSLYLHPLGKIVNSYQKKLPLSSSNIERAHYIHFLVSEQSWRHNIVKFNRKYVVVARVCLASLALLNENFAIFLHCWPVITRSDCYGLERAAVGVETTHTVIQFI